MILALVLYCWLMRKGRVPALFSGSLLATVVAVTAFLSVFWLLDAGYDFVSHASDWNLGISAGILAGLSAAGPSILRFVPVLKKPAVRKIALKALLYVAGLVIPLGAVTLFYILWYFGAQSTIATIFLACVAIAFAFVAILLLNVNLTGLHRLYRDQLARTFVQPDEISDRAGSIDHDQCWQQCTVSSDQHDAERSIQHACCPAGPQERFLPLLQALVRFAGDWLSPDRRLENQ
jgi:hypothetical protein